MEKKLLAFALAACMLLGSLTACGGGPSSASDDTAEKSLVYNLTYEPPTLDSTVTADGAAMTVLHYTVAGLLGRNQKAEPVPGVAESWEFDQETLTYTFHLRSGVEWSNGTPVTAHDFVYAWRRLCSPSSTSDYTSKGFILKNGEAFNNGQVEAEALGVAAPDDNTLVVQLENPCGYALFLLTMSCFDPVNQAFAEACGDSFGTSAETMLCSGAYTISQWVHEDRITLVKNPNYWDQASTPADQITFVMMGDANAALNAFQAGEVDVLPQITAEQATALEAAGQTVGHYNNQASRFVLFNFENEFFANTKIRRAFSMAFDRETLAQAVLGDGSEPAYSYSSAIFQGVEKSFIEEAGAPFFHDSQTADARALLAEGLEEIGKTLEDLNEAGISIIVDENTIYQKVVAYLLEQWNLNLGVTVKAEVMPKKSRLERCYTSHDFDMAYGTWGPDYNDPDTNLQMYTTGHASNAGLFSNAQYDEWMALSVQETDPAQRLALLANCERMLMEEGVVAPLYFEASNFVVSDKIQGYAPVNWGYALDFITIG